MGGKSKDKNVDNYQGPTEDELVRTTIQEMMDNAFRNMIQLGEDDNLNLRQAAFTIGLNRVYQHYQDKGISL